MIILKLKHIWQIVFEYITMIKLVLKMMKLLLALIFPILCTIFKHFRQACSKSCSWKRCSHRTIHHSHFADFPKICLALQCQRLALNNLFNAASPVHSINFQNKRENLFWQTCSSIYPSSQIGTQRNIACMDLRSSCKTRLFPVENSVWGANSISILSKSI